MKFIHMADMHLGALPDAGKPWADTRARELWDTFSDICEACNRERADLLLIAGNLFDRQPLNKELKEAAYILGKLNRTQVVIMAGDADYLRENDNYSTYPWPDHVHFFTKEKVDKIYFNFLDAQVWGLSYTHSHICEACYDELSPEVNGTYHILLAHGGDENHIPINRMQLVTAGFDYVAMGHNLKAELREREKLAYAGSPEPLVPDDESNHGYILGEITPDGTKLRLIPIAKRSYRRIELFVNENSDTDSLLDELRGKLANLGMGNIFTVVLKGTACENIDKEALMSAGNILEIVEDTRPVFDYDSLEKEHDSDIVGRFLEISKKYQDDEVGRKARDYGLWALLGGNK